MSVVLMGVAGSGKSTVGQALAGKLGWRFIDADDHHSPASVAKMKQGVPLDEADRQPWLDRLNDLLRQSQQRDEPVILACSALKGAYRSRLARSLPQPLVWVYLKVDPATARDRLARRQNHFFGPDLVTSQFDALEEPASDAVIIDATAAEAQIVDEILAFLRRIHPCRTGE